MRQVRLVTTEDLARLMGSESRGWRVGDAVADLVTRGWLRPLPVRGSYEFLPAASGPWESGDPWMELRAALVKNPNLAPQVALGSAAFLRGYADRHPSTDIIIVNINGSAHPGLRRTYRTIRTQPSRLFGATPIDGIPVATPARLVLEAATWWRDAGGVMNEDRWIRPALEAANINELCAGALRLGRVTTARAGYLAHHVGNSRAEGALQDLPRARPVSLGPRPTRLRNVLFNAKWGVCDTLTSRGTLSQ